MKEILLTSSALILALLALRRLFRRTVSRRMQYALWLLVLVRLLVPVNVGTLAHNVLSAAEPVQAVVEEHQKLYGAIISGNVDAATETMMKHLAASMARYKI